MTDLTTPDARAGSGDPPAELEAARSTIARLERRLERARSENGELERLIEDRTRSLYLAQEELRTSKQYLEDVLASMHSAVLITDGSGRISSVGGRTEELTGRPAADLVGQPVTSVLVLDVDPVDPETIGQLIGETHEGELMGPDGDRLPVLVATSELDDEHGHLTGAVFAATDISERRRLELELRHAQRLESIGELAAGVAHEINTPIQYVSDGVRFVGEAVDDLLRLLAVHQPLVELATELEGTAEAVRAVAATEEEVELSFLQEEAPRAVNRVLDGVERVVTIVQALKQFSHPGAEELAPVDLNTIINNTLTVARNEYKYVAEIELDLGDIPMVEGDAGDLGQAFLNLIVNASHAIADVQASSAESTGLGRITISTWSDDEAVMVDVADTGGGIPAEVRERVFEPFFTTKEPGRGTGQGLAITRNQVVKKHGGRIEFEVDEGVGTTFHIWLPKKKKEV